MYLGNSPGMKLRHFSSRIEGEVCETERALVL